jgi:hypothetical protein
MFTMTFLHGRHSDDRVCFCSIGATTIDSFLHLLSFLLVLTAASISSWRFDSRLCIEWVLHTRLADLQTAV